MKIVFVAPRFHTNQVAAVESLIQQGYEVDFHVNRIGATEDHNLLQPTVLQNGLISRLLIKVIGDGGGDIKWHSPGFISYFRVLKRTKADVLIIRNPSRFFSVVAALAGRLLGVKILFYTQTPLYRRWSALKKAQAGVLMGVFSAQWITPLYGNRESGTRVNGMHYVPFPVKLGKIKSSASNDGVLRVLMVGKYNERKNARLLLDALVNVNFNFSLTIIGECVTPEQLDLKRRLSEFITEQKLESKVRLCDAVLFADMPKIYNQHDVYVLPARDEPASISVLEAISHGLLAICSSTCGTADYIKEGVTGYVFDSGSHKSLTAVLNDANSLFIRHRETIPSVCNKHAAEEFSQAAYLQALSKVIKHSE